MASPVHAPGSPAPPQGGHPSQTPRWRTAAGKRPGEAQKGKDPTSAGQRPERVSGPARERLAHQGGRTGRCQGSVQRLSGDMRTCISSKFLENGGAAGFEASHQAETTGVGTSRAERRQIKATPKASGGPCSGARQSEGHILGSVPPQPSSAQAVRP